MGIDSRVALGALASALLLAPLPAPAAGEAVAPPTELFSPSRLQTAAGSLVDPVAFAPAGVCAGCHLEIVRQWTGSMHSRAHPDPLYLALSKTASESTEGLTDRFCAGCHSPIAVAGGEVPPVGNPRMSRTGAEGLTCDFCHTIDRATGTGNLPAVLDPGPVKRGPREDALSPFHRTAHLQLSTQAEFCGLCHDVSHPLNNLPLEHTYTEWREGPYNDPDPARRVYCQDCHMRQQPGVPATGSTPRPDRRAKAADGGPWREHVWSHWFVGANAAMTGRLGSPPHAAMALERLRAAATLEIVDPRVEEGEVRFSVRVTNSGAGHYLPTGLGEIREVWIETSVADADGRVLLRSGGLDPRGFLEEGTTVYHAVMGDAAGKPTVRFWEADRILSDNRIPPAKSDERPFAAPLGKVRGPLTVKARLFYRSWSPEVAELAFGPGSPPAPSLEMAATEREFTPATGGKP